MEFNKSHLFNTSVKGRKTLKIYPKDTVESSLKRRNFQHHGIKIDIIFNNFFKSNSL